jgi:hypothetical protein
MPVLLLEGLRDKAKGEVRIHRKQKPKDSFESLMSYAKLLKELEKLSGRTHVINYLWMKHGLRNKDINVVFKSRKSAEVAENTVVFNRGPKSRRQPTTLWTTRRRACAETRPSPSPTGSFSANCGVWGSKITSACTPPRAGPRPA